MIINNDCKVFLKRIPDNRIDSMVTDPPAGINFMGKAWDKYTRDVFIKEMSSIYTECLRVLKPGAHAFVWALPRTSHWTATALEDAGFEIRDIVTHVFGSGFPKSYNIGKGVDKKLGNERETVGIQKLRGTAATLKGNANRTDWYDQGEGGTFTPEVNITKGNSIWEGWGTNLKPASENWILCRKPLSEKTIADNVLKWGTGGINIDGSRIGTEGGTKKDNIIKDNKGMFNSKTLNNTCDVVNIDGGRFPANFIHDGSDEVMEEFDKAGTSKSVPFTGDGRKQDTRNNGWGTKRVGDWIYSDEGNPSRFFYCSKPSSKEKDAGLEDMEEKVIEGRDEGQDERNVPHKNRTSARRNIHPTVKSIKLMKYLITMITPPHGIVLDPFMGSGSTGVACGNDFKFLGIEKEKEYFDIAEKRIYFNVNKQ